MRKLVLGHLGYSAPSEFNGAGPFHTVFDVAKNLSDEDSINGIDAVVVWGGEDISPTFYDEEPYFNSGPKKPSERDLAEWHLITEAKTAGIPMIGVCRGAQMMCAFAGGKLIQHVSGHTSGRHMIDTYEKKQFMVSSAHHQMMYPYNVSHELLGWSSHHFSKTYCPENTEHSAELDNRHVKEPEVVLFPEIRALAVQGHPEWHSYTDPFNVWFNKQIMTRFFL